MAVYKMDMEHLAQYLSDTKYSIKAGKISSTRGTRVMRDAIYEIEVRAIDHKEITATVDCFLDTKNNIQVRVYIPEYTYYAKTKELHPAYGNGNNELSFDFKAPKKSFVYSIPNRPLHDFSDFEEVSEGLLKAIEQTISNDINKFKGNKSWEFKGIKANISFIAYPSANHEEHDYGDDFER